VSEWGEVGVVGFGEFPRVPDRAATAGVVVLVVVVVGGVAEECSDPVVVVGAMVGQGFARTIAGR
jgi:hypothetical protein